MSDQWDVGGLARDYIVPPFSVLDTRSGLWRDRKAAWDAKGLTSGDGRKDDNLGGLSTLPSDFDTAGQSIFDPVLAELAVRWFSHDGWHVLDPFAGGSVRGIVTELSGRRYTGIDLRPEQVDANQRQATAIGCSPTWIVGDSRRVRSLVDDQYDMLLSCPPYFDLEVYSDDPADLSNAGDYDTFLADYQHIISESCALLRPNRFAVWVVGDLRDPKTGMVRGLVPDTISAFRRAGLALYNDAILLNQVGTMAMRAPRQFKASRKMGRIHQYVLVFAKGRPKLSEWGLGDIGAIEPQLSMFGDAA